LYIYVLKATGDFDLALTTAAAVKSVAREIGHIGAVALAENIEGNVAWMRTGDIAAFDALARHADREWRWPPLFREFGQTLMAFSHLQQGLDGAAAFLVGSAERAGHEAFRDWQWGELFYTLIYTDPARALELLEASAHRLPVSGRDAFTGSARAMVRVVEGLAYLGQPARAAQYYAECVRVVERGAKVEFGQAFECVAGIAAACGEQWDTAERHFTSALHLTETLPHVSAKAEVLRWHAWMLQKRSAPGDAEHARALLTDALAINRRLNMKMRADICEGMLARPLSS
jgi:hypothetical protein